MKSTKAEQTIVDVNNLTIPDAEEMIEEKLERNVFEVVDMITER